MSDLPGLGAAGRRTARIIEIAERSRRIAELLHEAAQEANLLHQLDPEGLAPELAILGDCLNFGAVASQRIAELMVERARMWEEEMREP